MAPSFILLHVITNEKTLKLKQIDRLPALPRFSPQKHVPITLVGIPVVIYTLSSRAFHQVLSSAVLSSEVIYNPEFVYSRPRIVNKVNKRMCINIHCCIYSYVLHNEI